MITQLFKCFNATFIEISEIDDLELMLLLEFLEFVLVYMFINVVDEGRRRPPVPTQAGFVDWIDITYLTIVNETLIGFVELCFMILDGLL